MCGGMFCNQFVAKCLQNATVKEFSENMDNKTVGRFWDTSVVSLVNDCSVTNQKAKTAETVRINFVIAIIII